jgi:hypothetical protein
MIDWRDYSNVLYVRHPSGPGYPHAPLPGGFYAQAPVEGCPCVVCGVMNWRRIYCHTCGNLGPECWACGRGLWWDGWRTVPTDDPALGA